MNHIKFIGFSSLTIFLYACAQTASENVNTPGIYADNSVSKSDDARSRLNAQLKVGGIFSNSVLELSSGDTLTAYNGSQSKLMFKDSSIFGDVEYQQGFDGDPGGTRYTITFNRTSSNESISSSVTLPQDFNFTTNYTGTDLSDADILRISWDRNSPYETHIYIYQDKPSVNLCGTHSSTAAPQASGVNIQLNKLEKLNAESGNCVMKIEVRRKSRAKVNAAFKEGGVFTAEQSRTDTFNFSY